MNNNKTYNSINCLKIVFSLMIVLIHTGATYGYPFGNLNIIRNIYSYGGMYGNYFFFICSGFFNALHYADGISENNITCEQFMKRRIAKVYPVYFCASVVQVILLVREDSILTVKELILNILLITTGWIEDTYPFVFPAWFFSQLIICYLVFYFITKWGRNNKNLIYILAIVGGYFLLISDYKFPFLYRHNGEGLCNFFVGVVLCHIIRVLIQKNNLTKVKLLMGAIILSVVALTMLGVVSLGTDIVFECIFVYFPCLFIMLSNSFFDGKLKAIGDLMSGISIYIFLWHIPIDKLYRLLTNDTGAYKWYMLILCLFSYISYKVKVFEMIKIGLKRYSSQYGKL